MRWLLAVFLCGCINTDPAVFVEGSIEQPSIRLEKSSLVTGVQGGFSVRLHLGPRASGPSTVKLEAFSLVSSDATKTMVSKLGFKSMPASPITVGLDSTVNAAISLAASDNQLPADSATALCAGPIRVRGVIEDSLRGTTIFADSQPFSAGGCP
jgi:hypothetical protein